MGTRRQDRMRTTDCTVLTGLLLLSRLEDVHGGPHHQYNGAVRDLYPEESHYQSYLLPPPSGQGDIERQDPATVAGLSIAMIGMAFSAAFTGAVIAPVLRMGTETVVETVRDIRMPVFPKEIFDQDYPQYEDYEYEDVEEEVIDSKKKNRGNKKQNINY